MRAQSRSRSPLRQVAPSVEAQDALLEDFATLYWAASDGPGVPPWYGLRAKKVTDFRSRLVDMVEFAVKGLDDSDERGCATPLKCLIPRWQLWTFCDDLARMSDVLFRGPMDPRHADEVSYRLHSAWRPVQLSICDFEEFHTLVRDYRVSAVRVAMMLETSRPPEADKIDAAFELPDARTLASLLSLRCEKDDVEELIEMYRLVCQKLEGDRCTFCSLPFDECSSAGLFEGADALVVPATIPKVFVSPCGHAVHTLCFGSQIVEDDTGLRGLCRCCGLSYAWTPIDVDPMVNAFCSLFGNYVDRRTLEMREQGEVSRPAVERIAEVCQNFSQELDGLVSPASAWLMLTKRHSFSDPETVDAISDLVIECLLPPDGADGRRGLQSFQPAIVCAEDRDEGEESADERDRHVTEVFLPDVDLLPAVPDSDAESDEAFAAHPATM